MLIKLSFEPFKNLYYINIISDILWSNVLFNASKVGRQLDGPPSWN